MAKIKVICDDPGTVFWEVKQIGYPNDVLEFGEGVSAYAKYRGKTYALAEGETLIRRLEGREKVFFFRNKPLEDCRIFGLRKAAVFEVPWGVSAENATEPSGSARNLTAAGRYSFKLYKEQEFAVYFNSETSGKDVTASEAAARLRPLIAECVRVVLAETVSTTGIAELPKEYRRMSERIRDVFNSGKTVAETGIWIEDFVITSVGAPVPVAT